MFQKISEQKIGNYCFSVIPYLRKSCSHRTSYNKKFFRQPKFQTSQVGDLSEIAYSTLSLNLSLRSQSFELFYGKVVVIKLHKAKKS